MASSGTTGSRANRRRGRVTLATLLSAVAVASGCGGDSEQAAQPRGEVVITCAACQRSSTDPFLQYNFDAVQRFNKRFAGRYRVDVVKNAQAGAGPGRLQYYQRLALADDLPDLFLVARNELESLAKTGKLMDFGPALDADEAWRSAFYPGAFDALRGQDGEFLAVPQQRDSIGIYANRKVLAEAGTAAPQTWQQVPQTCDRVKAAGKICMSLDGDWATLLMWANLIGTQDGGRDFLGGGLADGDYASNPAVVRATETLKAWHDAGYVNEDSLSGDYANASTPFVRGEAAMTPNGPWMVETDIKGKNAVDGLYRDVDYGPSPGWASGRQGVVVVAGNGGWVSGAQDEAEQQAVAAFTKFITSQGESLEQTRATGAYPAVRLKLDRQRASTLEPLAARLVDQSTKLPYTYPHVYFAAPAGFQAAWKNTWPSYVKGDLDTTAFLERLADRASLPTA